MKKVCLLATMILFACSMARAEVHIYDFGLDGAQAGFPQSPGTGHGHVIYDDSTNALSWNVTYQNLLGSVTNAHFHGPAPLANPPIIAPVIIPNQGLGNPMTGSVTLTESQETQLVGGLWYWNIHTTFAGGGEIRGQVVP